MPLFRQSRLVLGCITATITLQAWAHLVDPVLPDLGEEQSTSAKVEITDSSAAAMAQRLGTQDWNQLTSERMKSQTENWVKDQARTRVLTPLQQQAQDLLGEFGKAQVSIAVDGKGDFSKSAFSLFTPWYEDEEWIAFSQAGIHDQDGRSIMNLGAGVRQDRGKWLHGYNVFLDRDLSRGHNRLGLGGELWSDFLRLSGNYYHPLSGWKDSPDFDDYEERPARGFDVRLQGYLPAWPHLGASTVWEQYYGDEVALFGKDNLQRNPRAVTLGVDYTPFPLATVKVSHREGQQGKREEQLELKLNYQMGTALKEQLEPDNVAAMRSLMGSRYDNVDRNYDIVLEYREKSGLLTVDLAAVPGTLLEGDEHIMVPLVKSKYRITGINWLGDTTALSLVPTAGELNPQHWKITLPAWDPTPQATNRYNLSVRLADEKGHDATSNIVEILVGHQRRGQLVKEGANAVPASGILTDAIHLAAWLEDHQGELINDPHLQATWTVKDVNGTVLPLIGPDGACPSDANGQPRPCIQAIRMMAEDRNGITHHVTSLISTLPGTFMVTAGLGSYGETEARTITFHDINPGLDTSHIVRAEILDPAGRNLLDTGDAPQVGATYTVRLFDAEDQDITEAIPPEALSWQLDGSNTAGCAITLNNHDTGVTGYQFTPRVNAASNSGVPCGDQGFGLKVSWSLPG
ncbi:murein transglycosylase [Enterobacter bugandensis]|uniref:inverse autotransporter beta domain-containing protein n=1 Tax=Enterobacter bugandensis TaxID=881260 RepID=UPI0007B38A00|nr:inverse autotransporter beta domain-containing protein [Enterobacter bugandensis]KZP65725.1 murein transglycosylase [Enterobacter bugandensis]